MRRQYKCTKDLFGLTHRLDNMVIRPRAGYERYLLREELKAHPMLARKLWRV